MKILETLLEKSNAADVPFLLIGGFAMMAHGLSRQTGDVDLLVCEKDRDAWRRILEDQGYQSYHDSHAFLQFQAPAIDTWPIDLMLVDEHTFHTMKGAAQRFDFDGVVVETPHLDHLLALKLHALKQGQASRELKDLDDVLGLLSQAGLEADSNHFKTICLKFGNEAILEEIKTRMARRKSC